MKPLVSIMIPCFNHEKYIKDCLESILALTYPRLEVLIMDDASEDQTFSIAESYRTRLEKKAERVLIDVNRKNLGICGNCNKLWKLAKGDYYKFIASDDFLMADGINSLVDYFETHPECNIVHGNRIIIGEKDRYPIESKKVLLKREHVPSGFNLTEKLLENNFIVAAAAMISKSTKEQFGIYADAYSYEDWEYWLRVSVYGRIDYIENIVVAYRNLKNSASHFEFRERNVQQWILLQDCIRIFEIYESYATQIVVTNFFNEQIKKAYLCGIPAAIDLVSNKIQERKVKVMLKTRLWVLAYKIGLYKLHIKLKKWLKIIIL